jgi:hypothetical protein
VKANLPWNGSRVKVTANCVGHLLLKFAKVFPLSGYTAPVRRLVPGCSESSVLIDLDLKNNFVHDVYITTHGELGLSRTYYWCSTLNSGCVPIGGLGVTGALGMSGKVVVSPAAAFRTVTDPRSVSRCN